MGLISFGNSSQSFALTYKVNGSIVFASSRDGNFEIYVMDSDGTNEAKLTNTATDEHSPAWSQNGTKIAFVRSGAVYLMDSDGKNVKKLTPGSLVSSDPAWSPDGTKIAFSASKNGTDRDIYVIDSAGGKPKVITASSKLEDFEPSWSPDGSKIVLTSGTNASNFGIFLMNADGSERVSVTGNASGVHPSWSPDGEKIVFSANRDKSYDIYTLYKNGTGLSRLTSGAQDESYPSWSPDSKKIVFTIARAENNEQIYSIKSDGTEGHAQRLTDNSYRDLSPQFQPLKSPVKEKFPILRENGLIAFTADIDGVSEIRVAASDGSNVTELGSITGASDTMPRWSP
ncbi:MAG TPA: DPP IV N-terminal domain-containing protein, partial [Nitrososphaera sp.]|nr:DPP IV N-terminal domain-containing protein [Nitrososphaera sp.]